MATQKQRAAVRSNVNRRRRAQKKQRLKTLRDRLKRAVARAR